MDGFSASLRDDVIARVRAADVSLEEQLRQILARPGAERRPVDLVINANDLTSAHGTGVLLGRVLKQAPDYLLLRAFNSWGGAQTAYPAAEYVFGRYSQPRAEIADFVATRLRPWDIGHILSVPYTREDVVMAIVAQAITGAPLSIWVMDDNCLVADGVPRALMAELVRAASARFAISPSLRDLYAETFDTPFHMLPPLVASELLRCGDAAGGRSTSDRPRAAIVGNIWTQSWLDRTLDLLAQCDIETDWYTSAGHFDFLTIDLDRLRRAGVSIRPGLDARETAMRAAAADFVLAPSTDMAEDTVQAASIGHMSLPSKLAFVTAAAGAPIMVLANGPSGAADYVRRFDLGEVSTYEVGDFRNAVDRLRLTSRQIDIRQRSLQMADGFDVDGSYELITRTAQNGRLTDDRFDRMFASMTTA